MQEKPLFLVKEERDAAQILSAALARDGIEVRLNTTAVGVRVEDGHKLVDLVSADYRNTIAVDAILASGGRSPNVEGLNLEACGVDYDAGSGIHVNDFLRTSNPHIYAAGDVCLEHRYGHTAAASARIAVQNALFRGRERLSALVDPVVHIHRSGNRARRSVRSGSQPGRHPGEDLHHPDARNRSRGCRQRGGRLRENPRQRAARIRFSARRSWPAMRVT